MNTLKQLSDKLLLNKRITQPLENLQQHEVFQELVNCTKRYEISFDVEENKQKEEFTVVMMMPMDYLVSEHITGKENYPIALASALDAYFVMYDAMHEVKPLVA